MKKFKIQIPAKVNRAMNRAAFKLKKHSPEILVVSGVIGIVSSAVMACVATTKLDSILAEAEEKVDKIHEYAEHPEQTDNKYTVEDSKKDLTIVYVQTGIKVARLYAPAVGIGVVSIAAILGGHGILRKRNVALAAAYKAVDTSFKDYRKAVIDRFGDQTDKELQFGLKEKEITETVKDEKGKEKQVKKTVMTTDGSEISSPYARFYDQTCVGWEKNPEYNLMFLRRQQEYATNRLHAKGHLFLNEVYDMLGIERTAAGQCVGWIYDEEHPVGDNYVDFGIYDVKSEAGRRFVNGLEPVILLDFNVDGNILDMM